ncbi:unnamed protein product [Linum tenue]|uniref:FRIGIDA-like protein n=1 Tax=Linum tenue TaxID=586396 RepID=A0AAV0LFR0_9ROSI|nr:unnamed protein product [Linum tenue]
MQPLLGDTIGELRNSFSSFAAQLDSTAAALQALSVALILAEEKLEEGLQEVERKEKDVEKEVETVNRKSAEIDARQASFELLMKEISDQKKHAEKAAVGSCYNEAESDEKRRRLEAKEKEIEECSHRFRLREKRFEEQLAEFQVHFNELNSRQRHVAEQERQCREIQSNNKHWSDELGVREKELQGRMIEFSRKMVKPDLRLAELSKKERELDEKEKQRKEIELKVQQSMNALKLTEKDLLEKGEILDKRAIEVELKERNLEERLRGFGPEGVISAEGVVEDSDSKEKRVKTMFRESEVKVDKNFVKSQFSSRQWSGAKPLWSDAYGDGNTESADPAPVTSANLPAEQPEMSNVPAQQPERVNVPAQQPEGVNVPAQQREKVNVPTQQLETVTVPAQQPERVNVLALQLEKVNEPAQQLVKVNVPTQQPERVNVPAQQLEKVNVPAQKPESSSIPGQQLERLNIPDSQPGRLNVPAQHLETLSSGQGCSNPFPIISNLFGSGGETDPSLSKTQLVPKCIAGRTPLKLLCRKIESNTLYCLEISDALELASDTGEFVLGVVKDPSSLTLHRGNEAVSLAFPQYGPLLLLDRMWRMSPHVKPDVEIEALSFARKWRLKLPEQMYNNLEPVCFLLFLAAYKLVSHFNQDELFSVFGKDHWCRYATKLFGILGFKDLRPKFLKYLLRNKLPMETLESVNVSSLLEKSPSAKTLLNEYLLLCAKKLRGTEGIGQQIEAIERELTVWKSVVESIADQNLSENFQAHILSLEKQKQWKLQVQEALAGPPSTLKLSEIQQPGLWQQQDTPASSKAEKQHDTPASSKADASPITISAASSPPQPLDKSRARKKRCIVVESLDASQRPPSLGSNNQMVQPPQQPLQFTGGTGGSFRLAKFPCPDSPFRFPAPTFPWSHQTLFGYPGHTR